MPNKEVEYNLFSLHCAVLVLVAGLASRLESIEFRIGIEPKWVEMELKIFQETRIGIAISVEWNWPIPFAILPIHTSYHILLRHSDIQDSMFTVVFQHCSFVQIYINNSYRL